MVQGMGNNGIGYWLEMLKIGCRITIIKAVSNSFENNWSLDCRNLTGPSVVSCRVVLCRVYIIENCVRKWILQNSYSTYILKYQNQKNLLITKSHTHSPNNPRKAYYTFEIIQYNWKIVEKLYRMRMRMKSNQIFSLLLLCNTKAI